MDKSYKNSLTNPTALSRRKFFKVGAAAVSVGVFGFPDVRAAGEATRNITIGIFTDSHYADRKHAGSRYYRDSDDKLKQFVGTLKKADPSFAIVLGDFVDKGKTLETELGYLKHIEAVYAGFKGPRHHVIGNHDVATFTKQQFVEETGMPAAHYSFDNGPFHFIVLDANYNRDFKPYNAGNFNWTDTWVPPDEQDWLKADLARTQKQTVAFIHQPLDDENKSHGVKNGDAIRELLEASDKVIAVFQGHNHRGGHKSINGIHYFTMRAMVEGPGLDNNSGALAEISTDGAIRIDGIGKQPDRG